MARTTINTVQEEVYVTETHEYIQVLDDGVARVGITDYAADQLGDVVFVELPEVDDEFDQGDSFGTIESVKASSELYLPISGKVTAVNNQLEEDPDLVNDSPFGAGWMVEISFTDAEELGSLMNAEAYTKYVADLD